MGANLSSAAEDAVQVMNSIRRLVQALRRFDRRAESSTGLSGAQVFVLHHLRDGSAVSVNELAARTCTDQSSVSVVAKKLIDEKLVRGARSRRDGRRVELSITPLGRRCLDAAPESAQGRIIAALHGMPSQRRRQLADSLQELVRGVGLENDPATLFFEDAPLARKRRRAQKAGSNGE
jgi:DNA-binding MarR family transcriptional regulator